MYKITTFWVKHLPIDLKNNKVANKLFFLTADCVMFLTLSDVKKGVNVIFMAELGK